MSKVAVVYWSGTGNKENGIFRRMALLQSESAGWMIKNA